MHAVRVGMFTLLIKSGRLGKFAFFTKLRKVAKTKNALPPLYVLNRAQCIGSTPAISIFVYYSNLYKMFDVSLRGVL